MKHYVYRVTNTVNGRIYIGIHSADSTDDYLGSGKAIEAAIRKYGRSVFHKDILHTCATRVEAYAKEAEMVTEEFVSRKDTYNLRCGGDGFTSADEARQAGAKQPKSGKRLGGQRVHQIHPALKLNLLHTSEEVERRNANPQYRERHREGCISRSADPAYREKLRHSTIASTVKSLWADPEYRQRIIAAQNAGKARSKAARLNTADVDLHRLSH